MAAVMSAARATLVSATIDTVASRIFFIVPAPSPPLNPKISCLPRGFLRRVTHSKDARSFPTAYVLSPQRFNRRCRKQLGFQMNVVTPILFQAKLDPPAPALCAPGTALGVISYARLARFIHNVAHRAISVGIAPKQIVAIQVKDHIFHTALALGLMHIGAATVSVGANFPAHLRADAIITDTPRAFSNGQSRKVLAADFLWLSGEGLPVDQRYAYRGSGEDFCRIALTSGSTGEAKAVGFTHNNQLARLARYNHIFGRKFAECSRFFSDYGLGSSGGFRHILYVLSRGGTMFFPGASPMDTLQAFELYKVQGLIASPGGLSGFLKFYEANNDFRSGFEVIISAGSPLPNSLSERVRARLCSNLIFYYGTTETSTISSAPAHALRSVEGTVGY